MSNIKVLKCSEIELIKGEWKRIEKEEEMTYFQSYDWNEVLVEQFKGQVLKRAYRCIRYVCLFDEEQLKVVAPLRIKKLIKRQGLIKEIELLGEDSFSDYVNFIYSSDVTKEEFEKILNYIEMKWKGYTINWKCIPKDSVFGRYLEQEQKEYIADYYKTVVIRINKYENFDDYFQNLSKSTRQNYRTSCNRMKRDNVQFDYNIIKGNVDNSIVDRLLQLNLERTIEKNPERFNRKYSILLEKIYLKKSIIRSVMSKLANNWTLVSYMNDREAGFLTGVYNKKNIYVMMNKVRPEYEFYSPMIVSIIKMIEVLYSKNFRGILDFGRGTEEYKYKLGGEERILIAYNKKL